MNPAPADLEARRRALRQESQRRFDSGPLGRRGTVNRALSEWVDGHEFLLPHTSPTRAPVPRVGDPQATEPRVGEDAAR